jgi:hypothetical protein
MVIHYSTHPQNPTVSLQFFCKYMCITCNVQTHLFPTSMNLNQDAAGKTEWHFCYFAGNELSDATLIESISYSPNTISTCMKHFHGMQVTPVFVLLLVLFALSQMVSNFKRSFTISNFKRSGTSHNSGSCFCLRFPYPQDLALSNL